MVQKHSRGIEKAKCPEVDYMLGYGDIQENLTAVQSQSDGTQSLPAKSYLEAGEVQNIWPKPSLFEDR